MLAIVFHVFVTLILPFKLVGKFLKWLFRK